MIRLSILPETIRIDLGKFETKADDAAAPEYPFAGAWAIAKPLDIDGIAKWRDAFPGADTRNVSAVACVRQQLVGIEGLAMKDAAGNDAPYDHANALHYRSLPSPLVGFIFGELLERGTLPERLEKNSASPSA